MPPTTVIINASYIPPSTTIQPLLPTFIARYDFIHTGLPTNARIFLREDARRLSSAARSWRHTHDFFAAARFYTLMNDFRISWSNTLMAKKPSTPVPAKRPEWKGFLERPLTEDEIAAVDAWQARDEDLWEHISGILVSQIDISLSYSPTTKAFTCTFKDQRPDSASAGYAISARDENEQGALKMMIYKHNACLEGDWSKLLGGAAFVRRG